MLLVTGIAMILIGLMILVYSYGYKKGETAGHMKCPDPHNHKLPAWTIETEKEYNP